MDTSPKEIVALRNGLSAMTASRLYHIAFVIPSKVCRKCLIERNLMGLVLANKTCRRGYGVFNPVDAVGGVCSTGGAGCWRSGGHRCGAADRQTSGIQNRPRVRTA